MDVTDEAYTIDLDTSTILPNETFINSTEPPAAATQGYCGQDFKSFGDVYTRSIHGYTSLIVCVFGTLANTLNLIVLTRKEMINPTNAILTGLALADLLNMVEYIPFAIYMNFLPAADGGQRKTYGWALFVLAHSNFSQVCHTISIWLTLTLAVWRYIMVAKPLKCKTLCTMDRAKWAICSAYLVSPLLCVPIYFTFAIRNIQPAKAAKSNSTVVEVSTTLATTTTEIFNATSATTPRPSSEEATKYIVNLSDLAVRHPVLMNTNFWLYSVVIKLIPCIMLTVVSLRLINSLMEAKKRKDKLLANKRTGAPGGNQAGSPAGGGGHGARNNTRGGDESGGSDRTTRMLLAILLLFLITEFPQGLLSLLSGLLGDAFFKSCYIPLADLMDFVALLNSAINFILYCSMSKKFRDTFYKVFHLDELAKLQHRRRQASINHHIASPSASRQLLGKFNDTEQTSV